MKLSKMTLLVVGLSLAAGSTVMAQSWGRGGDDKDQEQKVKLLGTIPIPGPKPFASTDIAWADQTSGLVLTSDRSNLGVDVIDGRHDLFVGRVMTNTAAAVTVAGGTVGSAAAGTLHFQGLPTAPSSSHWEGPNGVVTTDDKKGWVADGDSTVKVIDLDPASPTYLSIIAQISTAMPGSTGCTGGAFPGTCERADEIAYDPDQKIIVVANDEPVGIQPFLTFISSVAPYTVLGQFNFTGAPINGQASGGLEQPVWDPELRSFLQTIPVTNATTSTGSIAVIKITTNPFAATVERTISHRRFRLQPERRSFGAQPTLGFGMRNRWRLRNAQYLPVGN